MNTRSLRFANYIRYEKSREARKVGSCGSRRTQRSGTRTPRSSTRTPRSSTRTRTHRNIHRNNDRQIVAYRGQSFSSTSTIALSTSTTTILPTWVMIDQQQATLNVSQCSSHPHPPRPLLPPAGEGEPSGESKPYLVRMAHAKTRRRKENREPVCVMLGAQPQLFVTPLRLPGEEKGSGDEVGEHAQFAFCELHKVRKK